MDEALTTPPTYQLHFSKQIYCVELSPYEWSQHLICVALAEEIVIGTIKFQVKSLSFIIRVLLGISIYKIYIIYLFNIS